MPVVNMSKLSSEERKKVSREVSKLRAKAKKGKELSADETAKIEAWESAKKTSGRPAQVSPGAEETQVKGAGIRRPKDDGKGAAGEPPPPKSLPSGPGISQGAPPPPPPPKVESGSDWRQKYRVGDSSREATCAQIASYWAVFNKKLVEGIRQADPSAKVPLDEHYIDGPMYKAMVLTVDKMLPEKFEMGPEVEALGGTSILLVQRLIVARKGPQQKAKEDLRRERAYVNAEASPIVEEKESETVGEPKPKAEEGFRVTEDMAI